MAEHLNLIHSQTWPHSEDQSLPPHAYTALQFFCKDNRYLFSQSEQINLYLGFPSSIFRPKR